MESKGRFRAFRHNAYELVALKEADYWPEGSRARKLKELPPDPSLVSFRAKPDSSKGLPVQPYLLCA